MPDFEPTHIPVLIISGGIVGLKASLFLTHQGVGSLLVERHTGTSIHPRACSLNAWSMEIYRGIGIADLVPDAGASLAPSYGIYSGTSLKSVVESNPGKKNNMSEHVLLAAARQRGGDLRFDNLTECLNISQDPQEVTATLKKQGESQGLYGHGRILIAADGVTSLIRSQLVVSTACCGSMGHLLNILFAADLKSLFEKREFSICPIERPEVIGLFTSINNNNLWVFHLFYDPDKGEKAEDFLPERYDELLKIALDMPDININVISILPWEPSVRVATKLKHGRMFLAGDAAHQDTAIRWPRGQLPGLQTSRICAGNMEIVECSINCSLFGRKAGLRELRHD